MPTILIDPQDFAELYGAPIDEATLGLQIDLVKGEFKGTDADGRYKIHDPRTEKHPITQAQAWNVFQSALTLFRFKEANGYED